MTDARFTTTDGRPVPAVTAEEMREVDRVAVEKVGLQLLQMMENAGRALAATARDLAVAGEHANVEGPYVVFAGAGGNGGGGLCAARHLSNHGGEVYVVLDRDPGDLAGAAAAQFESLQATDATVGDDPDVAEQAGVVVDAVIGYGLTGPVRGQAKTMVEAINRRDGATLALDVPSGIDATTGDVPGADTAGDGVVVDADRTLTLALPKTGLVDETDLWLADIGIPAGVYERAGVEYGRPFDGRQTIRLLTGQS